MSATFLLSLVLFFGTSYAVLLGSGVSSQNNNRISVATVPVVGAYGGYGLGLGYGLELRGIVGSGLGVYGGYRLSGYGGYGPGLVGRGGYGAWGYGGQGLRGIGYLG